MNELFYQMNFIHVWVLLQIYPKTKGRKASFSGVSKITVARGPKIINATAFVYAFAAGHVSFNLIKSTHG